ncbi:hypothetical protein [Hyalangium rubrum]|uniref:Uncharacterized protein n=1 Tax=Hyalangium rubrum TaxID=3103134 RepID=A0ABU5GYU3_9BACT|nr:hypothetical protein [Hyalangium sp. s54d21]MDY7226226.1 hypothetical protein [Hyalangium sp. s54d21]
MNSRLVTMLVLALSLQGISGTAWAGAERASLPTVVTSTTQAVHPASPFTQAILALPAPGEESIRSKLKACLLTGDLSCVLTQWMALTGTSKLPDWLLQFQNAFAAANRQAGKCVEVAKAIHRGLSSLGQHPSFVRFTVQGDGQLIGFDEIANGKLVRTHQVSDNGLHFAVKLQGRIIDAYTGLAGLPEEEYLKRLVPYPGSKLITEAVEHL